MVGSWTTAKRIAITVSLHLMTNVVWADSSANSNRPDESKARRIAEKRAQADATEIRASAEKAMHDLDAQMQVLQEEVRMLRMREVDIESEMQRATIGDNTAFPKDLQRAMIDIQHQLQRRQLDLERVHMDRDRHMEQRELMRMSDRFEYVANWQGVAFEPSSAVMMATQAIVELNIANGRPERAAEQLESLLKKLSEPGCRTAIRFALKDVYTELGFLEKAEQHMLKIILENAARLQGEDSE